METKVFGNNEVPVVEFDLLKYIGCFFDQRKFAFAFWTGTQFEFDSLVDWVGGEEIGIDGFYVPFCTPILYLRRWALSFRCLGGLTMSEEGWLREIGGVLFEGGSFFEGRLLQGFEFGNAAVLFCDRHEITSSRLVFYLDSIRIQQWETIMQFCDLSNSQYPPLVLSAKLCSMKAVSGA